MKMKTLRKSLEECDLSPAAILERIGIALEVDITPGKTLLVIDEIQESANVLTSLEFSVMLPKIRLLWHSISSQLSKENKKFVYTALKAGAWAREYESALQWLEDAGMLNQVFRVGTPRLPLRSYNDFSAFKLYAHDVGLLGAMSDLPPSAVLDGNALFTNFKGALTEQYVLQELQVAGFTLGYWTNDAGNAEVEFVVQGERAVYPVEVKAGINTQAKSLNVYRKLFAPPFAVRTSLAPAHDGDAVKDVPLYVFGSTARSLFNR